MRIKVWEVQLEQRWSYGDGEWFPSDTYRVLAGTAPQALEAAVEKSNRESFQEDEVCEERERVLESRLLSIHCAIDLPDVIDSTPDSGVLVGDGESLRDAVQKLMDRALTLADGNKTEAAKRLGISIRTMHRWVSDGIPNWSRGDPA